MHSKLFGSKKNYLNIISLKDNDILLFSLSKCIWNYLLVNNYLDIIVPKDNGISLFLLSKCILKR